MEQQTENNAKKTRSDYNRTYYQKHKEELLQRAKEKHATTYVPIPIDQQKKRGRKEGPVGSYKARWMAEMQASGQLSEVK